MKGKLTKKLLAGVMAVAMVGTTLAGCSSSSSSDESSETAAETSTETEEESSAEEVSEKATSTVSEFFEKFTNADQSDGPSTRWWVYDSSVTEEQVHSEMADIADKGYSCVEVCNKGGYDGGLGTDEWNDIVGWILDACEENNLSVAFSYQNDSPISLPDLSDTSVEGEQVVTKLVHTEKSLTEEDFTEEEDGSLTFTGTVDLPSTIDETTGEDSGADQEFVAVTVAKVTGDSHVYEKTASTFGNTQTVIVNTTELDPDSMITLDASYDGETLNINWELDEGENPEDYIIFVWFAEASGSTINIFSESGAKALVEYWQETYYTDRVAEYLETNSFEVFEDSIEISSEGDIVFTWSMLDEMEAIEEETGYDMLAYLPLAIGRSYAMNTTEATAYGFAEDESGNYTDEQYWNEYTDILSDMFAENHLVYLSEAFAELNVTYRVQAYSGTNSNFYDITNTSAALTAEGGIAEGETLAFMLTNDGYDAWRYLSGGTHMAGGQLITNEYSALINYAWRMTFADMVDIANKSVAGGANYFINHGYNSDYDTEEWPGYSAFGDIFTEAWDDRDPSWENYEILTDYLNRLQTFAQEGTAKLDLAVWYSGKTVMDPYFEEFGITEYGYSYEFVNSTVLDSDEYELAVVTDGVLAEEGSAYKAIILYNETALDMDDMEILSTYAQEGLPIIFVGEVPSFSYSLSEELTDSDSYDETLSELLALENVYTVEENVESVVELLISLNIEAAASYSDAVDLQNIHRQDETGDYYWFYNPNAEEVVTAVTIQGSGAPYLMDLWTGEIQEITDYITNEDGTLTIELDLEGLDTKAITVTDDEVEVDGTVELAASYEEEEIDLTDSSWTLDVVSFTEDPDDPNNRTGLRTALDTISLSDGLVAWNTIEDLETVSGTGTYTTTFELDEWDGSSEAILDLDVFGEMGYSTDNYWHEDGWTYYANGTMGTSAIVSVSINGTEVSTVNQTTGKVSIEEYLVEGENTLEIEISTTLYNARYDESTYESGISNASIIIETETE